MCTIILMKMIPKLVDNYKIIINNDIIDDDSFDGDLLIMI